MQVTFIRHLPTEWNKMGKLQGRMDISLLPVSKELAKGIRHNQRYLKKLAPFDIVLSSSLKRTQQTAEVYGYKSETDALLDELDFGPFEGRSKEELHEEYGKQWLEEPKTLVLGESMAHLEERILSFLKKYQHFSNLLVFGHGSWIRAMISYSLYSHINDMNKVTVDNNACFTLLVNPE
ncbi:histidine phosphatase family protein [Bacillus benzoevorans]|uniref:Broad specificity phosphatase PhoE n=1 Tax=Bacillus benzoevorans TaxID=1456 RepID=A0A7X0HTT2_9BACI|nr:histidine phosphatase family protein [Bacillus benzoevorans]MBB6446656.1 broad specificity phosphatase PhoE [Bacillus benzoevorans]